MGEAGGGKLQACHFQFVPKFEIKFDATFVPTLYPQLMSKEPAVGRSKALFVTDILSCHREHKEDQIWALRNFCSFVASSLHLGPGHSSRLISGITSVRSSPETYVDSARQEYMQVC